MKHKLFIEIFCLTVLFFSSFAVNLRTVNAASQVNVLSHMSYLSSSYLYIIGEVQNTGTTALRFVKITATLYDSTNTVVGVDFTYASLDTIAPSEKSPFKLMVIDSAVVPKVDHYSLATSFSTTSSLIPGLQMMSNSSYVGGGGYLHIVGEIKNIGTSTATFVKVYATCYDSAGKVVLVDYTYTSPYDIDPNATAPFDVLCFETNRVPLVASYSLIAQSDQYSAVPEMSNLQFVIVMITLLPVALLLGTVLSKNKKRQ